MAATRPLGAVHARVDSLASTATLLLDAERYSGSGSWLNVGTGGALDAALPGGANNPKWLAWSGTNYTFLPGVAGNHLSLSRAAQAAPTTFELAVRVTLETTGASQFLAGWNGTFAQFFLTAADRLSIDIIDAAVATRIGTAVSSVAVPGLAAGTKFWLRGQVTTATASCAYWYSLTDTDDYASVVWTSVGTPQIGTGAGLTPSVAQSTTPLFGSVSAGAAGFAGILHAGAEVLSGVTTIKFNTNTTSQSSFPATTGGTLTMNRSTTGRKLVQVTRPQWLDGTDDYLTTADNALLDLAAGESGTFLATIRQWATLGTGQTIAAKRAGVTAGDAGWSLQGQTTTTYRVQLSDGANTVSADTPAVTLGAVVTIGWVLNRSNNTLTAYADGVAGTPASAAAVGSIANAETFRHTRLSGAGTSYGNCELFGTVFARTAWTAAEIDAVSDSLNAGTLT